MRYLVTGGCGFIGSHISEELTSNGHSVIVFDNLSSGHRHNIEHINGDITLIEGDIRDAASLDKACEGVDFIFHEAALVSVFDSVERPGDNNEINITGTLNVLQAARKAGVRRVVFASSAAVYGEDPTLPKKEDMRPQPESPYGLAKITGEYYLSVFAKLFSVETTALRYFNVFGPRQDPSSMYSGVISKFNSQIKAGKGITVFGDGGQTRDFVYVKDIVQANMLAMHSTSAGKGDVFNVGTGSQTSLLELLAAISGIYEKKVSPEFREARAGDIRHSCSDITKARSILGYNPRFSLKEGLAGLAESQR